MATHPADFDARIAEALREKGVSVSLIGPATGPLQRHPQLSSAIDQAVADTDVVHIHTVWEEPQHLAARSAKKQNVPYLISPHGMLDPWSLSQSKWKKKLYLAWRLRKNLNDATALSFTTPIEQQLVRQLGLRPPGVIEVLGLDLNEYETLPPARAFHEKFPEVGDRRIVLFLSRLHLKKGLDLLLPAFAQAKLADTVLVLAGPDDDGYQADVQAMVQELGLDEQVIFTGMLFDRDKHAALAAADLFVLPSYQENFGLVVIEAMAAGLPVVISDQVNLHPMVTEAGAGEVIQTQTDQVADAITRWMQDDAQREAVGEKARAEAFARFAWPAIGERWVSHYDAVRKGQLNPRSQQG